MLGYVTNGFNKCPGSAGRAEHKPQPLSLTILGMHPLIEEIERSFLPQIQALALELQKRYLSLRFNVWHAPEGSLTDYQGYSLGVECVFPAAPASSPNNVALSIGMCHLDATPLLMADVVWGHPSGESEGAFPERQQSINVWSEATPEILHELDRTFPELIQAFETAVHRAAPQSPPRPDFGGMTTNERLSFAGLMPDWDEAARSRDRTRMIEILSKVDLANQADQIADTLLANPKRYGL